MKKQPRNVTDVARKKGSSQPGRGSNVFEFALTFSVLLVLLVGLIEIAHLHNIRHAADNAAYEAARTVVVPGASASDASARASQLLARAGVSDAKVVVSPSPIGETTDKVTVRVEVPIEKNSWLPRSMTNNRSIARETTLMTERMPVIQARAVRSPQSTSHSMGTLDAEPGTEASKNEANVDEASRPPRPPTSPGSGRTPLAV